MAAGPIHLGLDYTWAPISLPLYLESPELKVHASEHRGLVSVGIGHFGIRVEAVLTLVQVEAPVASEEQGLALRGTLEYRY